MRRHTIALTAALVCFALAASPVAGGRSTNLLRNGTLDRSLSGWTLSAPQAYCGGTQNIKLAKARTTTTPTIDVGAAYLNACGGTPKPSISQTASVVASTTYTLTGIYYVEPRDGMSGSDGDFIVRADGSEVVLIRGDAANGWRSFSAELVTGGAQTSVALEFVGEAIGDFAVYVDDLRLEPAP